MPETRIKCVSQLTGHSKSKANHTNPMSSYPLCRKPLNPSCASFSIAPHQILTNATKVFQFVAQTAFASSQTPTSPQIKPPPSDLVDSVRENLVLPLKGDDLESSGNSRLHASKLLFYLLAKASWTTTRMARLTREALRHSRPSAVQCSSAFRQVLSRLCARQRWEWQSVYNDERCTISAHGQDVRLSTNSFCDWHGWKADDPSKVVISYGVNDCVPRMIVVDKAEIIVMLFDVQERLPPSESATTTMRWQTLTCT
jgi:hypothetical protein